MMNDVECPYCGTSQDICHDDGVGYEEDVLHEQECIVCDKVFTYNTMKTFNYSVHRADCLNGAPHKYKASRTFPVSCTDMECETCDATRLPTKEEWVQIRKNHDE